MFSVEMQQENRIDLGEERVYELKIFFLNKSFPVVFELKSIGLWFKSVELPLVVVQGSGGRKS